MVMVGGLRHGCSARAATVLRQSLQAGCVGVLIRLNGVRQVRSYQRATGMLGFGLVITSNENEDCWNGPHCIWGIDTVLPSEQVSSAGLSPQGVLPSAWPVDDADATLESLNSKIEAAEFVLRIAVRTSNPRDVQRYRAIIRHSFDAALDLTLRTTLSDEREEAIWVRLAVIRDWLGIAR